jgi:putative colanic acid biosynthesis acetyltransferase WcaF
MKFMDKITIDLRKSKVKWSYRHKLLRISWLVFQPLLFFGPRYCSPFRILLLKLFGAKIGKQCLICKGLKVKMPWLLVIGDTTAIAEDVEFYNFSKLIIGSTVVISQKSILCDGSHDYLSITFPLTTKPIVVNDSVWIASRTFVGPGVTINEGAVIGACSVVTKDMPEWMVCAGHPCKPIKKREFEENA